MPDATPIIEAATIRWEPSRTQPAPAWPQPPLLLAMARGVAGRCPCCGGSRLFARFLRIEGPCRSCDAPLARVQADDAPPYFTIFIVGHLVVGLMLLAEQLWAPPVWVLAAVFVPMTVVLSIGLLQPVKGATVALMLRLGLVRDDDEAEAGRGATDV